MRYCCLTTVTELLVISGTLTILCGGEANGEVPAWVVYPDAEWHTLTPPEAGIRDVAAWNKWVDSTKKRTRGARFQGEDHSGNKWGVAITRGGYLIQTFGDSNYKFQTASLGKAFTIACLQLAIDEGLIKSADDLIMNYWSGAGKLNSRHKYLNEGRSLRFRKGKKILHC